MDEAIGIIITLGVFGGYLYINWYVASRLAFLISELFAKDNDDEVIAVDEDRGMGRSVWRPVSRGQQRFKYWLFLVVLPIVVYVNYSFWDTIWSTMDHVATTLVQFAARYV